MVPMSIPRALSTRGAVTAVVSLTTVAATLGLAACTSTTSYGPGPAVSATPSSATPSSATPSSGGNSGGGNSGEAGSPAIVPENSTISWQPCAGANRAMQCASIQVPLNYADPQGRKITLALSLIPATAPVSQQQGVLLVNRGGPGASGLSFAGNIAAGLSPRVAATYDIVGFDPRGVGSSVPALSCDPSFFAGVRPNYTPANATAEQVLIDRAKTYAADCEKRFGWFLPYMTTVNTARDMDQIRAAFGVQQISYYAFSYGTYLGQVYGTLFPNRVRRMVLDSTVDPTGAWYADNISQDNAFQNRLDAFFAWVAKYDSVYRLGATTAQVDAAYYLVRMRLTQTPIDGPDGPLIGPDELDDTFLISGYVNWSWPDLAQALSQYVNSGNTAGLVSVYSQVGAQHENSFAVYNAIECGDVNWPRNWSKWQSDTEKVYQSAPYEAWLNAWYNAACAFWPVTGPATPFRVDGAGLPPILMLQGTLDPATPYPGAQDAHKLLPSARMVVVQGSGIHGQSMADPPNPCVQNYLNSYLATGALPEQPGLVNATCQAEPEPTPGT
jgi:pimeloyl-ACP methyl ester carboxylesterase